MAEHNHPLVPPPELVGQWVAEIWHEGTPVQVAASDLHIATRAAQWGADQELTACCKLLQRKGVPAWSLLRLHRRPKPPSLKEQAIAELDDAVLRGDCITVSDALPIIRRALEQLDD